MERFQALTVSTPHRNEERARRNARSLSETLRRYKRGEKGARFEIEVLDVLTDSALSEVILEYGPEELQGKRIDLFFPRHNLGIELYSPSRQTNPLAKGKEGMSDQEIRMELNKAVRYSCTDFAREQAENLACVVGSKSAGKGLAAATFPTVVLVDGKGNDLTEQFTLESDERHALRDGWFLRAIAQAHPDLAAASYVAIALRTHPYPPDRIEVHRASRSLVDGLRSVLQWPVVVVDEASHGREEHVQ